jgi:hypothetical protein
MDIEIYFDHQEIGLADFTPEERKVLANFALIWSLFEFKVFNGSASAREVVRRCDSWAQEYGIDDEFVDKYLNCFKHIYVLGNQLNKRYWYLKLESNDQESLVRNVLLGKNNTLVNKLACSLLIALRLRDILLGKNNSLVNKIACCLPIVLRYRNNYSHGNKWLYHFKYQINSFEHSSSLLAECLDRYGYWQ